MTERHGMDFAALSKVEAEAYLRRFVAENPASLARLRGEVGETANLDGSVASLGPLWTWALPRLSFRAGYTPPAPGVPPRRIPLAEEPVDELPSWFEYPGHGFETLSPDTLWLVDRLGRYFGDVLVAAIPGARWAVGRSRVKGYADQNWPVVLGPSDPVNPLHMVVVAVMGALYDQGRRSPGRLREVAEFSLPKSSVRSVPAGPSDGTADEVFFEVLDRDHPRFTHQVSFDDVFGHVHDEAVDDLVGVLAGDAAVTSAVREDREVVLVEAPTLSTGEVEQRVRRWVDSRPDLLE